MLQSHMERVIYPTVYPPKHQHACKYCPEVGMMKVFLKAEHGNMSGNGCSIVFTCNGKELTGTLHNGGGPVVTSTEDVRKKCPGNNRNYIPW